MKLIFIYGAPATGKLTVATELVKLTGYKLCHNHMTVDIGLALFEYSDIRLVRFCHRINSAVFDAAANAGIPGLIFTWSYAGPEDDQWIHQVIDTHGSNLYFVHLSCEESELINRVGNEDRKRFRKVADPEILKNALRQIDYAKIFPHQNTLALNTTTLPPEDSAKRIVDAYNLP